MVSEHREDSAYQPKVGPGTEEDKPRPRKEEDEVHKPPHDVPVKSGDGMVATKEGWGRALTKEEAARLGAEGVKILTPLGEGQVKLGEGQAVKKSELDLSPPKRSFVDPRELNGMDEETVRALQKEVSDTIKVGREFLAAAERGNASRLVAILGEGFPVNYQDPETDETALHIVAGCRARKALRVLLGTGQCDHLRRDRRGRLASEVAYLDGRDPAVARLLGVKERHQARAQEITISRRP